MNMHLRTFVFFILSIPIVSFGSEKMAPSFSCEKAKERVEKLICQNNALAELDRKLAAAFQKLLGLSPTQQKSSLKRAQAKWIGERNGCKDTACVQKSIQEQISKIDKQNRDFENDEKPDYSRLEVTKTEALSKGINQLKKQYGSQLDDVDLSISAFKCDSSGRNEFDCNAYYQGCASTSDGGRCCSELSVSILKDDKEYLLRNVRAVSLEEACKGQ